MKISELIETLSTIHEEKGDLEVFCSLGKRTSEFLVKEANFSERNDPNWPVPPRQDWLPARVVLSVRVV